MNFLTTAVILTLSSLPMAVKAQVSSEQVVGTWYAKSYSGNETTKKLVKRMDDHRYESISVTCSGVKLAWLEREKGTWKLEQNTLIHTPQSYEDYNGVKQLESGAQTLYSGVKIDDDLLSYKNANQTLLEFKPADNYSTLGCRNINTIN